MDSSHRSSVMRIVFPVLLAFFGFIVNYFLNLFVANHAAPHFYGDFSVAMRVLLLVTTLTMLGTDVGVKRFFSKYLEQGDVEHARNFMHWNLKIVSKTFLSCLLIALVCFIVVWCLHIAGVHRYDHYHAAIYMLWIAPLISLCLLLVSYMMSHRFYIVATLFSNVARYLFLLLYFIVAVFLFEDVVDSISLLFGIFVVGFVILCLQVCFIYWRAPDLFKFARYTVSNLKSSADYPERSVWLSTCIRLIVNGTIYVLIGSLDLIILEILHPIEGAVGHYSALLTITSVVWLIPQVAFNVLRTRVSSLVDKPKELQEHINMSLLAAIIMTAIIIALIVIFGKQLLLHFGPSYIVAYEPMMIVLASTFFGVISGVSNVLLAYSGNEMKLITVSIIELSIFALSGFILAHYFGMMGVAIATFVAIFIKLSCLVYFVKKNLSVRPLLIF